jgi:hypothetical protein
MMGGFGGVQAQSGKTQECGFGILQHLLGFAAPSSSDRNQVTSQTL